MSQELVIALVGPVGSSVSTAAAHLRDVLAQRYKYDICPTITRTPPCTANPSASAFVKLELSAPNGSAVVVMSWYAAGRVPGSRAAPHGGPVVVGEVGVDRHKITFFGESINTAARLEGLCRTLDESILVSTEVLGLLADVNSEDIAAVPRGEWNVKGLKRLLDVHALRFTGSATRPPSIGVGMRRTEGVTSVQRVKPVARRRVPTR